MQNIFQRFGALIIGIIFLAVGGVMYFQNSHLAQVCTAEAEATVVNMDEEFTGDTDSSSGYMYYPILEYTVNDEAIRVRLDSGSSTPAYSINDKLAILYNPDNTQEFMLKDNAFGSIFPLVFIGLGAIVTIAGIVLAIKK